MTAAHELSGLREAERERWSRVLDHFDACEARPAAGPRGCREVQALRDRWRVAAYALSDAARCATRVSGSALGA